MSDTLQHEGSTPRTVIENRSYERLLTGIRAGTVRLDTRDYRYRHTVNGTDMDDVMFDAEDRIWVKLSPGQPPQVTESGMQWLADRYAKYGTAPTRPEFMLPALPPPSPAMPPPPSPPRARIGHRRGERHPQARLTDTQVRNIKARLAAGATRNELAAEYRVAKSTISSIKNGIAWRHVAWPDGAGHPLAEAG